MKWKLTPDIGDGRANAAPLTVEGDSFEEEEQDALLDCIREELLNDEGQPFGVGFTLTIERVE